MSEYTRVTCALCGKVVVKVPPAMANQPIVCRACRERLPLAKPASPQLPEIQVAPKRPEPRLKAGGWFARSFVFTAVCTALGILIGVVLVAFFSGPGASESRPTTPIGRAPTPPDSSFTPKRFRDFENFVVMADLSPELANLLGPEQAESLRQVVETATTDNLSADGLPMLRGAEQDAEQRKIVETARTGARSAGGVPVTGKPRGRTGIFRLHSTCSIKNDLFCGVYMLMLLDIVDGQEHVLWQTCSVDVCPATPSTVTSRLASGHFKVTGMALASYKNNAPFESLTGVNIAFPPEVRPPAPE